MALRAWMRIVLEDWMVELSEQLGRPVNDLRQRGLGVRDFQSGGAVHLEFPDGSQATFKFAFFVSSAARNEVAVFTEHCGYHIFTMDGLEVKTIRT